MGKTKCDVKCRIRYVSIFKTVASDVKILYSLLNIDLEIS